VKILLKWYMLVSLSTIKLQSAWPCIIVHSFKVLHNRPEVAAVPRDLVPPH
jgi:hypothetical protein